MTVLRKLLETLEDYVVQALTQHDQQYQRHPSTERDRQVIVNDLEALRQALAQPEQGNSSPNYPISESITTFVDAVNMRQERVDETAKREHEPVAWFIQYEHRHEFLWRKPNELEQKTALEIKPLYTAPPISDYHEGWEEGFKAATREQEPFIYIREDNERPFGGFEHCSETDAGAIPVYTAPMLYTPQPKRKWVGIDEKEISWLWFWMGNREKINGYDFAKAIESKLKERNNG